MNLKVRLKNPIFWIQIITTVFATMLAYFGLTAQDIKDKVNRYMIETYERFDFVAETAREQYVYDENGTPCLDF